MSADERAISAGPPGGLRLAEDLHVQSTFSDDAVSTVAQNVGRPVSAACARSASPSTFVATPRGCLSSSARCRRIGRSPGCGCSRGRGEDLGRSRPARPAAQLGRHRRRFPGALDLVLIADHQFPGEHGPLRPARLRTAIEWRELSVQDAIERLVRATLRAAVQVQESGLRPLVAHLFSLLPKSGLAEDRVPPSLLGELAAGLAASQAIVEVNEKWRCPSARTIGALLAAGVPIVAGSDSHHCRDIGRYSSVRAAGALRATAPRPACRSTSSAGCSSLWSWPERSLGSVRRTST